MQELLSMQYYLRSLVLSYFSTHLIYCFVHLLYPRILKMPCRPNVWGPVIFLLGQLIVYLEGERTVPPGGSFPF